jgi:hypothetical protein
MQMGWHVKRPSPASCWRIPDLPYVFRGAESRCARSRARGTGSARPGAGAAGDRHRRFPNEAKALLVEVPTQLHEHLPVGRTVALWRSAAARLRGTGESLTDLRLTLLLAKAPEELAVRAERAALEHAIARLMRQLAYDSSGSFPHWICKFPYEPEVFLAWWPHAGQGPRDFADDHVIHRIMQAKYPVP